MAYTKIHAIKATVDKAIDYICNPEKTDEKMFVSSYACSPETAAYDFKYTLDHCRENSPNKAYHLIQAFAPGEVGYEEAHLIGKELADKVLEGKYSYVVTTHIDKGHIHNHIIFCAADNIEYNKYHDCTQTYHRIRHLSDELCKEHNLSVIIPVGERGKKYKKWQSEQSGSAWKTQIRKDINFCIKSASTYEEFLLLIRAKGYKIKGETFEEEAAKYISFRPLDKERFVRGSAKSLGKEYTKERIMERIERKRERKAIIPKKDFRRYESQIILYGGARRMLEQAGINIKSLNVDKLKAEYQELMKQKSELTSTYKDCEKEVHELNRKLENLNQYLGKDMPTTQDIKSEQKSL